MNQKQKEKFEKLDDETKKFILWAFEGIREDKDLEILINEVTINAKEWLLSHKDELRDKLMDKMIKGGAEHGAPIHPISRIETELEGEYLDLLGWSEVLKYNQKK